MTQSNNTNGNRGHFNYLEAKVESSLYRNGKVLTRRDPDGSDDQHVGVDLEDREMFIHNARMLSEAERRTVVRNGFEVLDLSLIHI